MIPRYKILDVLLLLLLFIRSFSVCSYSFLLCRYRATSNCDATGSNTFQMSGDDDVEDFGILWVIVLTLCSSADALTILLQCSTNLYFQRNWFRLYTSTNSHGSILGLTPRLKSNSGIPAYNLHLGTLQCG